ncbi:hypothetical protein GOZ83_06345 [Agrobacterium vitis]|uniref:hypothetical protein n=1 Tax=Agrobacterium vitis TaxID=373 RepID=UPI0012E85E5A|nr:hypothetical protein [Agrobacterium vitis]MVA44702.1 hypothetical protein [Agrobacterium vitis]
MIIVCGALGQIGSLVVAELSGVSGSVLPVDIGLNEDFDSQSGDTLIWCATSPPPHEAMAPFCDDAIGFIRLLEKGWRRVIFTSSFGIECARGVQAVNPYAAGKIASEAFLEAWCRTDQARSGVSIRMGGYGPLTDVSMPWSMNDAQVVASYRAALAKPDGFHIIRPLHQDYVAG